MKTESRLKSGLAELLPHLLIYCTIEEAGFEGLFHWLPYVREEDIVAL